MRGNDSAVYRKNELIVGGFGARPDIVTEHGTCFGGEGNADLGCTVVDVIVAALCTDAALLSVINRHRIDNVVDKRERTALNVERRIQFIVERTDLCKRSKAH